MFRRLDLGPVMLRFDHDQFSIEVWTEHGQSRTHVSDEDLSTLVGFLTPEGVDVERMQRKATQLLQVMDVQEHVAPELAEAVQDLLASVLAPRTD